mmetsp:Transcript_84797/g.150151  ORF Transcript_84797/g.150151 Transcript_84797/m.150151 type:complete len:491 (+) Transcript_84797:89-1561(+)
MSKLRSNGQGAERVKLQRGPLIGIYVFLLLLNITGQAFAVHGLSRSVPASIQAKRVKHASIQAKRMKHHGKRSTFTKALLERRPLSRHVGTSSGSRAMRKSSHVKPPTQCYTAEVHDLQDKPILSYLDGTSDFQQVFNPSWVEASAGTQGRQGLLIRTQNCSLCNCCGCNAMNGSISVFAFVPLLGEDGVKKTSLKFGRVTAESVVFSPSGVLDDLGTEDPRVTYDPRRRIYHIFYTCYGSTHGMINLCHATTQDPTRPGWKRHGSVGFGPLSKSGALLLRDHGPHYLFWGAPVIRVAQSLDLMKWETPGPIFLNNTFWDATEVEPGPPPLRLSTGDYAFMLNSWNKHWPDPPGYSTWWAVLSGEDPSKIIAQATRPLWDSNKKPWMIGRHPHLCSARQVTFLSAAHPTEVPDTFRVYFGGADAVIGTALVSFKKVSGVACNFTTANYFHQMQNGVPSSVLSTEVSTAAVDVSRHSRRLMREEVSHSRMS